MNRKLKNARAAAVRSLADVVVHGQSLDTAVAQLGRHWSGKQADRDRGLVQEITYGCVRWYLFLDGIVDLLLDRPLKKKDQDIRLLILVGLYQLQFLSTKTHAAVGETVAAAVDLGKPWAKGLINACLRNFLRNRDALLDELKTGQPDLVFSHPQWLLEELRRSWPLNWQDVVEANNQKPPMHLRTNISKTTRESLLERLGNAGIKARALPNAVGISLDQPASVIELPGFIAGELSVQDLSAQYAGLLLNPAPGERLLDACAAPGGKACHLLEMVNNEAHLTAVEIDQARAGRINENLDRLGLVADILVADAMKTDEWWDRQSFDRILVDAPCSATGVIRRHPDIKHHRRPTDIDRLVPIQAGLLDAMWPLLRQGGKLLYVTCSILTRENELQIKNFFNRHSDAREVPVSLPGEVGCDYGSQLLPGEGDGFYYCLLEKI